MAGCSAGEPLLGSVCLTAANYCSQGYLPAEGQALRIEDYPAVFSLMGTMYGGDGRTTFNLPDLRGAVPQGTGQRPGMSVVTQGATGTLGAGRGSSIAAATVGLRYCIAVQGVFPSRP